MSSRLVEASARFLNSYQSATPMGRGMTRDNNPYAGDTRSEDDSVRPVNLIREHNYDMTCDGLLHDTQKLSRARAIAPLMYEMRKAVEILEGTEFERQLDEQYGYETNRNTLRPGGGYGQSIAPVDAHGYDYDIDHDNYGNREPGYGSAGGNDVLDPQEAENLAKIASWRREGTRSNLGGGNFQTVARHLHPAPAELGRGARVGQENLGPQPAHHDGPYKAGSSFNANRALVNWMTQHIGAGGGRNDSLDHGYGAGFDDVPMDWDAPEIQTSARHDAEFHRARTALPFKDDAEEENERAFGHGKSFASGGSQHYRAHMDVGARSGGYGATDFDNENGDERATGIGFQRNVY
jgi:hypothetical protein